MSGWWRPSGVMHWRHFVPFVKREGREELHWRIWRAGAGKRGRLAFLALEALRWIFWLLVRGPQLYFRVRHQLDSSSRAKTRALIWGQAIPSYEVLRFGLDRDPERALDFIFDIETPGFHALMNGQNPAVQAESELLRDKVAAGAAFEEAGILTPQILGNLQGLDAVESILIPLARKAPVFCKSRFGHGSAGAFALRLDGNEVVGRVAATGSPIGRQDLESVCAELLRHGEVIISPELRSRRFLAGQSSNPLITLRHITTRFEGDRESFYAAMEVPVSPEEPYPAMDVGILPIGPETGSVLQSSSADPSSDVAQWLAKRAADASDVAGVLEHWPAIKAMSHTAHNLVPSMWSVAWDWAITEDGPVLLEGNSVWSLAAPQVVLGRPMARYWLDRGLTSSTHPATAS